MARTLVLIIVLPLLAVGCRAQSAEAERVGVALFDVSGSTNVEPIKRQYLNDFGKVMDYISQGGRIIADVIDDNPLAHSRFPIDRAIKPFNSFSENRLDYERRIRLERATLLNDARKITDEQRSSRPGSRIIEALQLAERAFDTYGGKSKVLIVFSDMIEQSDRYDFSSESLTDSRIRAIIEAERSAGRLPSFEGVEVCISGAGAAVSGGLPSGRLVAIRDFWLQYFRATGADLPKARYGATLIKCP